MNKQSFITILLTVLMSMTGAMIFAQESQIQTKRFIHVAKAGTLSSFISEEEKYNIEELTLTGEIDGRDIILIRDMAGVKVFSDFDSEWCSDGKLVSLDISDVKIVSGMTCYFMIESSPDDELFYTKDDTLSNYIFYGLNLSKIILPKGITTISRKACSGCRNLTSVTIPSRVEAIGYQAFSYCSSLTSITIPRSVTTIGSSAFDMCKGLIDIYCEAENVPETGSSVFGGNHQESITLHVPEGSIDAYRAAEPWKNFKIVALDPQCATPEISFVNGKIKLSSKTEGATYHYTITNEDVKSGNGDDVQLGMTYHVSAYATKDGFETSEVTTRDIVITGNGEAVVKGDVDGNGKVDAADVVTVTNIIMGK